MELNGLFPIVKRWLAVILTATAMAALIGTILGSTADKTYEAKARLLVGPLNTDTDTMRASGALAQTFAELATSGTVLRPVADELDTSSGALSSGVRATANSTTRFLVIRARAHQAGDAADIANGVTEQLVALAQDGPTRPEGQLLVLEPARAPSQPISPRLDLIVPLAAIAGLLGSLTLVLLFEFVGDTAESVEKVSAATGTVTIPVKRRNAGTRLELRPRADPLRVVATQVELAAPQVRSVLITGATDLDGTGGLVLDLAELWAERHGSVLVVDAGGGEITEALGRTGALGLGDLVTGRASQVTPLEVTPGLFLLTRGSCSAEGVQADQAEELLERLGESYRMVVVHAPSAATSAGTLMWARVADVTVLVARRFHARRAAIDEVAVNLRTVDAHLAFAVLHDAPRQAALKRWSERLPAHRAPVTPPPGGSPLSVPAGTASAWLDLDAAPPPGSGSRNGASSDPAHRQPARTAGSTSTSGGDR